jgi:hypothetical protein
MFGMYSCCSHIFYICSNIVIRRILAGILGLGDRVNWKECVEGVDAETALAEELRGNLGV